MTNDKMSAKRDKLLKKSKKLFKIHGYTDTTIKMITDEAGFKNQASFYRYFNNKEELGIMITRMFTRRIIQYMDACSNIDDDPLLRLMIHELLVYDLILTDLSGGRFVYELSRATVSPATVMLNVEYSNLIKSAIEASILGLTKEQYNNYLVFFTSGLNGLYMTFIDAMKDNKSHSFQDLISVFVSLLQMSKETQNDLNNQVIEICSNISDEQMEEFLFL